MHLTGGTCPYCGEPEEIELVEVWSDGAFQFTTCCEGLYEETLDEMQDPAFATQLLKNLQAGEVGRGKLRRVAAVDGQLLLDWNPQILPIAQRKAREFVNEHHEHNRAPAGWRFGAGIWNGPTLLGVIMVGRPVARALDASTTAEVNRLCLRRDVPAERRWNACSMAYGWAAREAKRRGFQRIITYTLETEAGTTLRAAGWREEARTKGGSWSTPSRPRADTAPTCPKVRWSRDLCVSARTGG